MPGGDPLKFVKQVDSKLKFNVVSETKVFWTIMKLKDKSSS